MGMYRYDEATRERLKTVEWVVQRRSPKAESECRGPRRLRAQAKGAESRTVVPCIGWRERALQSRVKLAGGRRDRVRRVWNLRREMAERLDLLHRVVGGGV